MTKISSLILLLGGGFPPSFLLYLFLLLVSIIYGFYRFWEILHPFKLLVILELVIFLGELSGAIFEEGIGTNYPFYLALQIVQFGFFGFIFYYLFTPYGKWLKLFSLGSPVLAVLGILIKTLYQGIFAFPSFGSLLLSLYMSVACMLLFSNMIKSPVHTPILRQSEFWFTAGSLFFHTVTFFIFGYFKGLSDQGPVPQWGYVVIRTSNFILYGCYFLSLYFASGSYQPPK